MVAYRVLFFLFVILFQLIVTDSKTDMLCIVVEGYW